MANIKCNDPKWLNQTFGNLKVIGFAYKNSRWLWKCECLACGGSTIAYPDLLRKGKQKSCHCGKSITFHNMCFKHGETKTRLHDIWCGMRKRCNYDGDKCYGNYGGRGISVCNEWDDYLVFKKWALENGYSDDLTIERKNVNGNYEPDNCCWIPLPEQGLNRTTSHLITYNGKTQTIKEWSQELGLSYQALHSRISRGWDIEKAITMPPKDTVNTLKSKCDKAGLNYGTVSSRINRYGWSESDALTIPASPSNRKPQHTDNPVEKHKIC